MVLTLEDQVGIVAATGAGKSLYLMVTAALGAPGRLSATAPNELLSVMGAFAEFSVISTRRDAGLPDMRVAA